MKCGEYEVAKSYIIYREEHKNARLLKERIDYMSKYINSSENAATASETDSNANVSIKNVANLEGEVYKTLNRQIQRSWMKERLNKLYPEVANQYSKDIDSHIIYVHDEATSPVPKNYCMAASLYPLMMNGTGEIDGVTPTPPNDIQSFSGQVTNLVFLLSSQVKGAVALGEYFVALNLYVVKEFGEDWYNHLNDMTTSSVCKNPRTIKDSIRKGMKQFIYGVSQPAGNRSYNSPFSNLNLFDSQYFTELFQDFVYPDGTKPEWKAIDTLQRIFLELHRELRLIKPLTFPVTTMCMVHNNNEILDKEYEQLCSEELSKGSSFFVYLSDSATSISSCCFPGSYKIQIVGLIDPERDRKKMTPLESFYTFEDLWKRDLKEFKVQTINPHTGVSTRSIAKLVKYSTKSWIEFRTKDTFGKETYRCTPDHIFPVIRDGKLQDVKAEDFKLGDQILSSVAFLKQMSSLKDSKFIYSIIDKIKNIDLSKEEDCYCIEIEDLENPYFCLGDGIITHNCRVRNELIDNTFSSTTGLTGVMTGSSNVITLNYNRIIQDWYKSLNLNVSAAGKSGIASPEFIGSLLLTEKDLQASLANYLTNILERVYKYHIAYKSLLYDLEDKGMFSSSNAGYIYTKKLYSTIGVIGYCEAAEFLGYKVNYNSQYVKFLQFILGVVQDQNKLHSVHDPKRPCIFNCEGIPGENLAVKFYNWDKSDGYKVPEDQNLYSSYFFKQWDSNISILDKLKLHGKEIAPYLSGGYLLATFL